MLRCRTRGLTVSHVKYIDVGMDRHGLYGLGGVIDMSSCMEDLVV